MSEVIRVSTDSDEIKYLCCRDKRLAKVIHMIGPITYKPYENEYSFLVQQIIGQMLGNKVASKITERLVALCDGEITPNAIRGIDDSLIKGTGMSMPKVQYIRNLTSVIENGELQFETINGLDDREVIKELTKIKGIGEWTAKMYLIFVLNRMNVLPYEDMAFLQAYGWLYKTDDYSKGSVTKKCRKWSPYSSLAARYLYKALDGGLTKQEFHLYK